MRVFVYEFTCAAGTTHAFVDSLLAEGQAMLSAVTDDLVRVSGVEVVSFPIGSGEEKQKFQELARKADFTLVIAPELDDILAERCQWVEDTGGRLLGPSLPVVRLMADKYALGQLLQEQNIPTPETRLLRAGTVEISERLFPAVLKPRFGAGSLATYLIESPTDLSGFTVAARDEGCSGDLIVQPFTPGLAVSVGFLIGPKQRLALLPANQNLSADGRFHYQGGSVPLPADLAGRACRLATRAIDQVPGLLGFVGVDLVLGLAPDGGQDYVIEINPRLTTSYIGLRALAESNLAEALLKIAVGENVAPLKWRPGRIQFRSDGRVSKAE
jgi:predicted ATP-grasp superfamily ATP-dependent carboligase